jgi:hypothetical protein
VKDNKSIVDADVDLTVWATIGDLSELIQNNEVLDDLCLVTEGWVSLEQSTVLSRAIANAQLERINIQSFRFENDGSFDQMLEGCSNVKKLSVRFEHHTQCTAVFI